MSWICSSTSHKGEGEKHRGFVLGMGYPADTWGCGGPETNEHPGPSPLSWCPTPKVTAGARARAHPHNPLGSYSDCVERHGSPVGGAKASPPQPIPGPARTLPLGCTALISQNMFWGWGTILYPSFGLSEQLCLPVSWGESLSFGNQNDACGSSRGSIP